MSIEKNNDYRDSHMKRGDDYDEIFHVQADTEILSAIEKRILLRVVTSLGHRQELNHLDFACGTGRITSFLHPHTASSIGIDVSLSMLTVARARYPKITFLERDITREPLTTSASFELITAFRFFPNAQKELRDLVMNEFHKMLRPGGMLIINNHQAAESNFERVHKALGRPSSRVMTHCEVEKLASDHGFRIVKSFGVGKLPFGNRTMRPKRFFTLVEGELAKWSAHPEQGRYRMYLMRKGV